MHRLFIRLVFVAFLMGANLHMASAQSQNLWGVGVNGWHSQADVDIEDQVQAELSPTVTVPANIKLKIKDKGLVFEPYIWVKKQGSQILLSFLRQKATERSTINRNFQVGSSSVPFNSSIRTTESMTSTELIGFSPLPFGGPVNLQGIYGFRYMQFKGTIAGRGVYVNKKDKEFFPTTGLAASFGGGGGLSFDAIGKIGTSISSGDRLLVDWLLKAEYQLTAGMSVSGGYRNLKLAAEKRNLEADLEISGFFWGVTFSF